MTIPQVLALMNVVQSQVGCAGSGGSSSCGRISLASQCATFLSSATPVQEPDMGALSALVSSGLAWFRYLYHEKEVGLVGQLVSFQPGPQARQK